MKKYILGTLFFLAPFFIISQEIISPSAGDSSGSGGSLSYTIGQVFFNTIESDYGSLVQGIQQPFEFQTLSTPALLTVQLTAVTYPNPTTEFVLLKISDTALENLQYTLFDLNGKTIDSKKINSFSTKITMKNFAIGMYLLKLTKNNQPLKTFKIIKKQ
jgi:hypothetical protein|tara:strand:- start:707 stop:1183 length:477 start_codon:yes stop_codon:yes gene_type:complete